MCRTWYEIRIIVRMKFYSCEDQHERRHQLNTNHNLMFTSTSPVFVWGEKGSLPVRKAPLQQPRWVNPYTQAESKRGGWRERNERERREREARWHAWLHRHWPPSAAPEAPHPPTPHLAASRPLCTSPLPLLLLSPPSPCPVPLHWAATARSAQCVGAEGAGKHECVCGGGELGRMPVRPTVLSHFFPFLSHGFEQPSIALSLYVNHTHTQNQINIAKYEVPLHS